MAVCVRRGEKFSSRHFAGNRHKEQDQPDKISKTCRFRTETYKENKKTTGKRELFGKWP